MTQQSWTLLSLLRWTTGFFQEHEIETARLDAEVLLAHVLGMKRLDLYLAFDQPVATADRASFRELVRRRAKDRTPVAYLTGVREFWSMPFRVSEDVLIPRPDTETLVRAAVELAPRRVVELGTGSGCVSAALARELPEAEIVAIECSDAALAVATRNLEALELGGRVKLVQSADLSGLGGGFDLIISNPPYIPEADLATLQPEVRCEPQLALDGGPDGLRVIREIAAQAPDCLKRPGFVALEIGIGQASAVEQVLRDSGADEVAIIQDLAGVDRVIQAVFREN
ncbi:MAG: peptide chain release factor N(5)-glutamine methyltransferase [bacterium]|nr:peptide chain release factor N(5)-glutamine methyltransferase [bacterium]